jgi:hypothetical protein
VAPIGASMVIASAPATSIEVRRFILVIIVILLPQAPGNDFTPL